MAHLYANGGLELNWKLLFFNDSNGDSRVSFECQLFVLQIILSILKKKTTTNLVACRTLLPYMQYHPAYVVRLLNERYLEGDPQPRLIPLEKYQFDVKLAWENNLLYSTPPLVSSKKDGETSFTVFFPLPSCCVSSLMYEEDNLWFPRSLSSQLPNPESALWCCCTCSHESLRNFTLYWTLKTHLLLLTGLRTLGNIRFEDEDSLRGKR